MVHIEICFYKHEIVIVILMVTDKQILIIYLGIVVQSNYLPIIVLRLIFTKVISSLFIYNIKI